MSTPILRRDLLRGASALTALSYSRVRGANDKVQLGLIGCGERGREDMAQFQKNPVVDVTAVCDIYGVQIDKARQKAPNAQEFHRPPQAARNEGSGRRPDRHARPLARRHRHRRAQRGQGRLRRKAAHAAPSKKARRSSRRRASTTASARSACSSAPASTTCRPSDEYIDTGKLGKITLARTWWHGNGYHLRKAPASLQTQPSNLDWARFLGPVKWRDWDPQQYWNWRAYLDFGGGQVTDLFTHWIDVVHMFMGQDIPIVGAWPPAASTTTRTAAPRPTPSTCCWNIPPQFTATFEATLAPGITGAAVEFCGTEGRLYIDRGRYEFHPLGRNAQPVVVKASQQTWTCDHVKNFLECVRVAQTAQRRRAHRPPLGAGLAPRQHRLRREAPHRFRSGAGRDPALLNLWRTLSSVLRRTSVRRHSLSRRSVLRPYD